MQSAIDTAYVFPNQTALDIPRKNAVPTIDEFVDYSVNQIKKEK